MFEQFRRERPLFESMRPPSQRPEWGVGRLVQYEGRVYRVTQWVELRPVLLERGGSARRWEVRGRRVSNRRLREEVAEAAERMLADE